MKKSLLIDLVVLFLLVFYSQVFAGEKLDYQAIDALNQKKILFYVNQYRQKHGLMPLQMSKVISQEAEKHSRDMAAHRVPFGHQYFSQRIKRVFDQLKFPRGGAENVAYNYKDGKTVVEQWLTSPGHRHNIEGHYNLTGIGLARDKGGKLYFTQIFVRTQDLG